jgi:hypothetical protein
MQETHVETFFPENETVRNLTEEEAQGMEQNITIGECYKYGGNYIWLIQNPEPSFLKNLNQFWKDVYKSWITITSKPNEEPLSELLYHNHSTITRTYT